ncbi:MAG: hypothetical protein ACREJG_07910, partial [Candidatus Rokuibacteriota bacterium]
AWDVVSGHVDAMPPMSRTRLWTQVPAITGGAHTARVRLWLPGGEQIVLPARLRRVAATLAVMPMLERPRDAAEIEPLLASGVLGPQDLPLRIVPDDPAQLDGWRFA